MDYFPFNNICDGITVWCVLFCVLKRYNPLCISEYSTMEKGKLGYMEIYIHWGSKIMYMPI